MRNQIEQVTHTFLPVFDEKSRVLVLGTMPSPKSREQGFYYGHPRNRFWKVLADVLEVPVPETIEEKKHMVLTHKIAIWDVLKSCEIKGAEDGSIKNPVVNDMNEVLKHADIQAVFATGGKAAQLYQKYCFKETGVPIIKLPSTSPANCGMKYETILAEYMKIKDYL